MIKRFYNGAVFILTQEGSQWCVNLANHNLIESPCGFGDTIAVALRSLAIEIENGEILQGPPNQQGCAT